MSGMPWFRLYTSMIDDECIRLLAFEDRWHFVALLCCKSAGILDSEEDPVMLRRKLSVKLGLAPRELEALSLRLAELGLIDVETFQPVSWNKLQFQSDRSTDRVRAHRERIKKQRDGVKKLKQSSLFAEEQEGNVSVTPPDTDTDTDTDTDRSKSRGVRAPTGSRLPPDWQPSEEDKAFARSKRPDLDVEEEAAKFRDHWHAAAGAEGRKADWSAVWRNWIRRANAPKPGAAPTPQAPPAAARDWRAEPESKLQNRVSYIRQQHAAGAYGEGPEADDERDRLIAEAVQQFSPAEAEVDA